MIVSPINLEHDIINFKFNNGIKTKFELDKYNFVFPNYFSRCLFYCIMSSFRQYMPKTCKRYYNYISKRGNIDTCVYGYIIKEKAHEEHVGYSALILIEQQYHQSYSNSLELNRVYFAFEQLQECDFSSAVQTISDYLLCTYCAMSEYVDESCMCTIRECISGIENNLHHFSEYNRIGNRSPKSFDSILKIVSDRIIDWSYENYDLVKTSEFMDFCAFILRHFITRPKDLCTTYQYNLINSLFGRHLDDNELKSIAQIALEFSPGYRPDNIEWYTECVNKAYLNLLAQNTTEAKKYYKLALTNKKIPKSIETQVLLFLVQASNDSCQCFYGKMGFAFFCYYYNLNKNNECDNNTIDIVKNVLKEIFDYCENTALVKASYSFLREIDLAGRKKLIIKGNLSSKILCLSKRARKVSMCKLNDFLQRKENNMFSKTDPPLNLISG